MIIISLAIGGLLLLSYWLIQIAIPVILLGIKGATTLARKRRDSARKKRTIANLESEFSEDEREKLKDEVRREMLKEELRAEIEAENSAKKSASRKKVSKKKKA